MSNQESQPLRRAPSLPTWEVMHEEPDNSSEDGQDQLDDESAANSTSPSRAPPSTQPAARPKSQPKPRPRTSLGRPPPSTQPAPNTRIIGDDAAYNMGKNRLERLNKPGKQPASAAASTAMPPPAQDASQASKEPASWNSSMRPNASLSSSGQASNERFNGRPTGSNAGEQSTSKSSSPTNAAIRDRNRPPAQSQPSLSRPVSALTRPRNTGSVSAPFSSRLQATPASASSQHKEKVVPTEVIVLSDSDDEPASASAPPVAASTRKDTASKVPAHTAASRPALTQTQKQKQPELNDASDSDSMPDFISVPQGKKAPQGNRNADRRKTIGGSNFEDFPPLSQSLRKAAFNNSGNRNNTSVSALREREIKDAAASQLKSTAVDKGKGKSVAGSGPSASQSSKRSNNREAVLQSGADMLKKKKSTVGGAFHGFGQNSMARNPKAGPSRAPPSTQPQSRHPVVASMKNVVPSATQPKARPKLGTSRRVTLPHVAVRTSDVIEVSDSDDDRDKNRNENRSGKRVVEAVIDLCSSDDEPSAVPSTQPTKASERPLVTQTQSAGPTTQPVRPQNRSGSPPAVRPSSRVSTTSTEKMTERRPQTGGSSPLDKSRRHSNDAGSGSGSGAGESPTSGDAGDSISTARRLSQTSASNATPDSSSFSRSGVQNESVSSPLTSRDIPQTGATETNSFDNDFGDIDNMDIGAPDGDYRDSGNADHMDLGTPPDDHRGSIMDLENPNNDVHASNSVDAIPVQDNAPHVSATAPSVDVDMDLVGGESASEQATRSVNDNTTQAEPTSTPIARAERLRSPSVSAQNEEELGDASEVDLLLAGSPKLAPPELASGTVQLDGAKKGEASEISQSGGLVHKSGTLTDKLEDMELDSSAETSKQVTPVRDDVTMVDAKTDHITSTPDTKISAPDSSSSTPNPSSSSVRSPSTPKISEKQARFNRGVSPEVNHVITRNLFGFYNTNPKNNKPAPAKDNSTSPNLKAGIAEPISSFSAKPSKEIIPESSSSDDEVRADAKSPQSPGQSSDVASPYELCPPPSGSVNNEEFSDSTENHDPSSDKISGSASSSSKSYGREIVPSPPPRRKISVVPTSNDTTADEEAGSSIYSRDFILGNDSESEELKDSSRILKNYESTYAKSAIATPRTNIMKAGPATATSSQLVQTNDHTPYIRRRMEEQIKLWTDEQQPILVPIDTSVTHRVSAEDLNITGDADDNHSNRPSSMAGAPNTSSPTGSSSSRTTSGPTDLAAPSVRLQVARKTTGRRKPRPIPQTNSTLTSVADLASQDESSASTSQLKIRKRTRSTSSATSNTSGDVALIKLVEKTNPKRRRTEVSNALKKLEASQSNLRSRFGAMKGKGEFEGLNASGSSRMRLTRNRSSTSSLDQLDILDGRNNSDRNSSPEQPVTPVTDLVEAVNDIAIVSKNDSYPKEVTRFFVERDYGPKWYHVNDIPTDFVNEVNNTPEWCKKPDLLREMFESAIVQNTAEDEPDAPDIQIINNVDDEPTPPFEFYYTNRLYHSDLVPPPDYKNLKGCTCIGTCDPNSKTCACIKRQTDAFIGTENDHNGFLYNDHGRLLKHQYPIYECNDACGCTEACKNRVVQKGRKCHVNIVKTKDKGWGVNAAKKIKANTFIGIYSGELLDDDEADKRGFVYNRIAKTYLFDLDFFHITQALGEDTDHYCVDAYHVGNFTRFLNHSCDPNCSIEAVYINEANIMKPLICLFSLKNIEVGEELTFSYVGTVDDDTEKPKDGKSYQKCLCGSKKCCGQLFTYGGTVSDEDDD